MTLDFTGITLPFEAGDLLGAGVSLMGVVGAFILLGLAFLVAPKLFTLIRQAFNAGGSRRA